MGGEIRHMAPYLPCQAPPLHHDHGPPGATAVPTSARRRRFQSWYSDSLLRTKSRPRRRGETGGPYPPPSAYMPGGGAWMVGAACAVV